VTVKQTDQALATAKPLFFSKRGGCMDEKDLQKTLDQYEKLGRFEEAPIIVDARLHAAVETAAASASLHPADLGLGDWAADTVKKIKTAVHDEICDASSGKVKDKYLQLLDKGTSKEAISSVSSVITTVMVGIHLAPLAVSTVVLYLAIWILKMGLNKWGTVPAEKH